MSHDKAKQLIRDGGDKLSLVIERCERRKRIPAAAYKSSRLISPKL